MRPIVLIPARLHSTRLPGKLLADIHGEPMIVHVWRRAMEADIGPVVVASEEQEIADAVRAVGGEAELTSSDHTTGSDRIFEALERRDPGGEHDIVVNLQGDLPALDPGALKTVLAPLTDPAIDISTLASPLDKEDLTDSHVVKVWIDVEPGVGTGRALAFSRAADPRNIDGSCHHHIGVYAYRRGSLARFVALPPSASEQAAGLEQLRAIEAGLVIGVGFVDTFPLGVDTPSDLARARTELSAWVR